VRETGLREERERELERLRGDLAGRERRAAELEQQHAELEQQHAELEQALVRETGLREERERELERLRGDLAGRERRAAELEQQHAELDGQLAETTADLAEERKRSAAAEEELRGELNRVVARLAEAEATVAASATPPEEAFPDHVVFLPGTSGYHLAELAGPPPEAGAVTEIEGVAFRVLKVGRSPLPDDPRRCAYLEAA
jgi:septal ring factor EnvC (AmiA/AmiB activator)